LGYWAEACLAVVVFGIQLQVFCFNFAGIVSGNGSELLSFVGFVLLTLLSYIFPPANIGCMCLTVVPVGFHFSLGHLYYLHFMHEMCRISG